MNKIIFLLLFISAGLFAQNNLYIHPADANDVVSDTANIARLNRVQTFTQSQFFTGWIHPLYDTLTIDGGADFTDTLDAPSDAQFIKLYCTNFASAAAQILKITVLHDSVKASSWIQAGLISVLAPASPYYGIKVCRIGAGVFDIEFFESVGITAPENFQIVIMIINF